MCFMSPVSVCGLVCRLCSFVLVFSTKKQDVDVDVSECCSAPLKVCLCICLSHLEQRFVPEKTCGGGPFTLKSMCSTNCRSSSESVSKSHGYIANQL